MPTESSGKDFLEQLRMTFLLFVGGSSSTITGADASGAQYQ